MIVSHVISTGWMPVVVSQIRHPLEVWYPIPTLTNTKGQEEAPPTNLQPQQYPSTTGPKTITPIFAHEGSGTKTLNTKHPLFASQILDLGCRSPQLEGSNEKGDTFSPS
jgi:hypothetical protein